jgi:hypothetical protein
LKSNSDNPNQFQRGGESQPNVQTVSQLTNAIKSRLADEFASVWVGGELSGMTKATSGHVYLTLKDASASLSGIIWRTTASAVKFDLKPGLEVVCQGYIDVYPQRGSYQLIIRQIQPVGVGELEPLAQHSRHHRTRQSPRPGLGRTDRAGHQRVRSLRRPSRYCCRHTGRW